jgi:hypothetical protein
VEVKGWGNFQCKSTRARIAVSSVIASVVRRWSKSGMGYVIRVILKMWKMMSTKQVKKKGAGSGKGIGMVLS